MVFSIDTLSTHMVGLHNSYSFEVLAQMAKIFFFKLLVIVFSSLKRFWICVQPTWDSEASDDEKYKEIECKYHIKNVCANIILSYLK